MRRHQVTCDEYPATRSLSFLHAGRRAFSKACKGCFLHKTISGVLAQQRWIICILHHCRKSVVLVSTPSSPSQIMPGPVFLTWQSRPRSIIRVPFCVWAFTRRCQGCADLSWKQGLIASSPRCICLRRCGAVRYKLPRLEQRNRCRAPA